MNRGKFDKLYFLAKLGGAKKVGELMIDLVNAGHEEFAFELVRNYSPGAIKAPNSDQVSLERPCNWSPFGYCFTNKMGLNTEQMNPNSEICIWCEKIYTPPNVVDFKISMQQYEIHEATYMEISKKCPKTNS